MTISILAAFWFVSFLFVITPGADWAFVISAGIRGRFAVVPSVVGLLLGHLFATFVIAAGLGGFIANVPAALDILTGAGAIYLFWLGINMVLHPSLPEEKEFQQSFRISDQILKGVCVSGLNPKVFLLFLALLPQFVDANAEWSVSMQIIALGAIHIISCGIIYLLIGFGSQRALRTRPSAAQMVSRASGIAMIAISLLLLMNQFNA
jgi:threonine/homoserine/homoserine lactone efflux protein